ncbi:hypothetical protein HDU80_001836 [Chytriomyces hyalinus]|nr:hypothetical protein HDU80_001836 [Chytriomyces hyalinus]
MKRLKLGEAVGRGAFGVVFRALHLDTGQTYAVKQIKTDKMSSLELRGIMTEIDLLKNLYHENIVSYQGFSQTSEHLNIIMEYCENGSLHSILQKFGTFPETLISLYIGQVLEGLEYLHNQGVIHRDIKAANILTTKSGTVKLADFGISSKLASGLNERESIMGSPFWMSPEIIELRGAVNTSDIWSVGCTIVELLEGKPPYYLYDPMSVLFNIVQDEHPPLPASTISKELHDFLIKCWVRDRESRPDASFLLTHAWIRKSQHKAVTKKSTSVQNAANAAKHKGSEMNQKFIIPETQHAQSDWDSDFIFEEDTPKTPIQPGKNLFDPAKRAWSSSGSPNKSDKLSFHKPGPRKLASKAESWDEDFEFAGGDGPDLKRLEKCTSSKAVATPNVPSKSIVSSADKSRLVSDNDYTSDFDFGSDLADISMTGQSFPSMPSSAPKFQQHIPLYSKEAVAELTNRVLGGKDVVDTCFELVAMFDIAPTLRPGCQSGAILNALISLIERWKSESEVLALMTLLNKLLTSHQPTKDRACLLGIVPAYIQVAISTKSIDVRREILFLIRELSSHQNTVCALLSSSRMLWTTLGTYLVHSTTAVGVSRSQEVAFDAVCCLADILLALPFKSLVEDQVCAILSIRVNCVDKSRNASETSIPDLVTLVLKSAVRAGNANVQDACLNALNTLGKPSTNAHLQSKE